MSLFAANSFLNACSFKPIELIITWSSPKIFALIIAPNIAAQAAINDYYVVCGAISFPSNARTDV